MVDKENRAWRKYSANFYPSLAYRYEGKLAAGEGMEGWIPIAGPVSAIVDRLSAAMSVGMAYIGASTIADVTKRARFILPTSHRVADDQQQLRLIINLTPLSAPTSGSRPASSESTDPDALDVINGSEGSNK